MQIHHSHQVAEFETVQLVRRDGSEAPDPQYEATLGDDELRDLYQAMVVTRALDQEFVYLQRQGQLGLYPSCRGQEAVQVGAALALAPRDFVFPQYRELGMWVARGVDPVGIGMMWRGTEHGGTGLLDRGFAALSIPIGTNALHAVGYAMGAALDNDPVVAVACLGDGAMSEGDVHEALNFAGVFSAPCVFLVQNNHYAISVPQHQQTRAPSIAHKAVGYGIQGVRCDGNDVLACYAVVTRAAERARKGVGPTLIEAVTYRMEAHTTSDDATRYRSDAELEFWGERDPIDRFRAYLRRNGRWSEVLERRAEERAHQAAQHLRDGIVDAPDGESTDMFDYVFVEPTAVLSEQREELRRELDVVGEDSG